MKDCVLIEKPLVSIIIPCYRQAEYISEAIESVISQTYDNWECIIIDDGSPDNTKDVSSLYIRSDKRIKYIYQENQGVSNARNNGILFSRGKYILPLDADDIIASTYVEKAVSILESHPEYKLVYCKAEKFGKESGIWQLPEYKFEDLLWNNMIFCSAMYRRCDYEKTKGYNPTMVFGIEDWDFWLSLLSPEDKVYRIDEVLFYYRVKTVSRTTALSTKFETSARQICRNHPELYDDAILLHLRLQSLLSEINKIKDSKSYRIGRTITLPYRMLKKVLKPD